MSGKKIIFIILLILTVAEAFPQKLIRGFVIDSASFIPLSYVNVVVKNSNRGTATDLKGGFSISCSTNDTLAFSLVGYNVELFPASELEETIIIRMGVRIKELEGVTIVARKEKPVRTIHIAPKGYMGYGPTSAGFDFGYFSKTEKEKRKLEIVRQQYERTKNYISVVCDPLVKDRICREYTLTNDQYFQLLAKFNIQNMNRTYDLTAAEWITVLRKFYAENVYRR